MIYRSMRFCIIPFVFLFASLSPAQADPTCTELNRLYVDKYIAAFSIDRQSFGFPENSQFNCDGYDKNFIIARAIHDLEILKPINKDDPNYYQDISQVMSLPDNRLGYFKAFSKLPSIEAKVFNDGARSAIFYTDRMIRSSERFRPTYTLVHEARHTIKGKTFSGQKVPDEPGHIACTRGKHKGKLSCDLRLSKEADLIWGSGNSHEFLFLIFVRDHPNASSLIKQEARDQLSYLATHMFNELEPGILSYYNVKLER